MKTILETFYALMRAKLLLLQCKRFLQWKHSSTPAPQTALQIIREGLLTLTRKKAEKQHATIREALREWKNCVQVDRILLIAQEKVKTSELKYAAKLKELKNQRIYLSKKISDLEQRKKKRSLTRVKSENADGFGRSKISLLLAENEELKQNLDSKEQQILGFFEEMTVMISRAKQAKVLSQ